jgi:hypothetical protein
VRRDNITIVILVLAVLAVGMQVRNALFWRHMAATTFLHVSSGTYIQSAVWGGVVALLCVFAIRSPRIGTAVLALLMAWYARGSFATFQRLNLGAPGEREIAMWAERSALFYLLITVGFASCWLIALLKRRSASTLPSSTAPDTP